MISFTRCVMCAVFIGLLTKRPPHFETIAPRNTFQAQRDTFYRTHETRGVIHTTLAPSHTRPTTNHKINNCVWPLPESSIVPLQKLLYKGQCPLSSVHCPVSTVQAYFLSNDEYYQVIESWRLQSGAKIFKEGNREKWDRVRIQIDVELNIWLFKMNALCLVHLFVNAIFDKPDVGTSKKVKSHQC